MSPATSTAPSTGTDWRSEFYEFEDAIYLATAAQGALPRVAIKALEASLELKRRPFRIEEPLYHDLPARVRASLAQLTGAAPEEIGITTGASSGLAGIASALEWEPGDEILVARGEFPAQVCTWAPVAAGRGAVLRMISPRDRFMRAQDFLDNVTPRTRMVSASLVRFDDGSLLDSAALASGLAGTNCKLLLDITQACGAMPLDLRALGADFAVCAGYKWLMGPYGSGFVWARREHTDRMRPAPFYWMSAQSDKGFHELTFDPDADGYFAWKEPRGGQRWDVAETASFFHLSAFTASLEFLLRAAPSTVLEHNRALLKILIDRLPMDRMTLASPADQSARGPYVCIRARNPEATGALFGRLKEQKIYVSLRNGALRVAPYLYNTEEDMEKLLRVISV